MNSADIKALIRGKYAAPEWATIFEVRNAAGFDASRSADAVAMNLWPSRGLAVEGFEVKVSKTDWQRELKAPGKADAIARYCDFWWIVAPEGIVNVDDLPRTWGLQTAKDGKLKVVKQAEKLEGCPLDRGFIAAMLRRATEQISTDAQMKAALEAERKLGHQEGLAAADRATAYRKTQYDDLSNAVREFEKVSGVSVRTYEGPEKIGQAVRTVLSGNDFNERMRKSLDEHIKRVETHLGLVKESADGFVPKHAEATP